MNDQDFKPLSGVIAALEEGMTKQRQSLQARRDQFRAKGGRCVECWDTGILPGELERDKRPKLCHCEAGAIKRQSERDRHAAGLMVTSGASRYDLALGTHPNKGLVEAATDWCDRSWLSAIRRSLDVPTGGDDPFLLMHGAVGVGKTQIAAALLRRAIRKGADSARLVPMVRLLDQLRPGNEQDKGRALLAEATEAQAVVLDDLGRDHRTDWVERVLYQIVDERYSLRRWTIITTNRDPTLTSGPESLVEWVGEACYERIIERAYVVNCGGPDRNLRR